MTDTILQNIVIFLVLRVLDLLGFVVIKDLSVDIWIIDSKVVAFDAFPVGFVRWN